MTVNWLEIMEIYLFICLAFLHFSQKRRYADLQQRLDEFEDRLGRLKEPEAKSEKITE